MSFTATRWAWAVTALRPSQKLLLLALADRADETGICWPSLPRLQKDTGLDVKTIRAGLARLCSLGLISRSNAPGRGYVYALAARAEGGPAASQTHAAPAPQIMDAAASENGPPVPIVPLPPPQRAGDPLRNGPPTPAPMHPLIYQEPTMNHQQNLKDTPPPGAIPAARIASPSSVAPAAATLQAAPVAQDNKSDSSAACASSPPFAAASSPPCKPAAKPTPKSAPKPAPKEAFGRFGHVRLTPEEHAELLAEHGERGEQAIAKLDLWLGARGDRYKSHYMAIHSWVLKAVAEDARREEALLSGAAASARFYGSSAPFGPSGASGPHALPPGASGAAGASGASGAAFASPQPSTYAQLERANQKNVARLALLGRGVYDYGKQTDDYHGTVHDVDPVQPAGG